MRQMPLVTGAMVNSMADRMATLCQDFAFIQSLDGDRALEPRIAGAVNLAHPSRANKRDDLIGAEFRACGQHHRRLRLWPTL